MRGLFGDVIADQVMGYVLCFARNLHTYIRQQVEHRYEPAGGEAARVSLAERPGHGQRDGPRDDLPARRDDGDRRPRRDRRRDRPPGPGLRHDRPRRRPLPRPLPSRRRGSTRSGRSSGCRPCSRRATSSSSPPRTRPRPTGLFDAATIGRMRPSSYLINIGRGAIVVLDDLVAALRRAADRRGGARRLRGRAAAGRPPALGLPERHHHPAHGRLLAGGRPAAPGGPDRQRPPLRPGRAAGQRRRQGPLVLTPSPCPAVAVRPRWPASFPPPSTPPIGRRFDEHPLPPRPRGGPARGAQEPAITTVEDLVYAEVDGRALKLDLARPTGDGPVPGDRRHPRRRLAGRQQGATCATSSSSSPGPATSPSPSLTASARTTPSRPRSTT